MENVTDVCVERHRREIGHAFCFLNRHGFQLLKEEILDSLLSDNLCVTADPIRHPSTIRPSGVVAAMNLRIPIRTRGFLRKEGENFLREGG
jgi:hypothetical protein